MPGLSWAFLLWHRLGIRVSKVPEMFIQQGRVQLMVGGVPSTTRQVKPTNVSYQSRLVTVQCKWVLFFEPFYTTRQMLFNNHRYSAFITDFVTGCDVLWYRGGSLFRSQVSHFRSLVVMLYLWNKKWLWKKHGLTLELHSSQWWGPLIKINKKALVVIGSCRMCHINLTNSTTT